MTVEPSIPNWLSGIIAMVMLLAAVAAPFVILYAVVRIVKKGWSKV